ncbi:biopolymer transporter ExbD [Halospina sp. K52047b]|jgi:biopolymer transport protein ExbD|uniref:ExbD/TolR family protein n=1 Tax=Halospina sp. K52047b TaxID=2614160 RepID=UPI00124A9776|nr:biopolymer transporter ExbD [Halospina sp. K52047b]KAA8982472.1 biopolymer transporter ExbD [Halospina sp. K52047b]
MKASRRARRIQRHYRRMNRPGGLNLTALMDIFTILVFFLMVNSSDVQVLQEDSDIQLPRSAAEQVPESILRVVVAGESILVGGSEVARLDGVTEGKGGEIIADLQAHLAGSVESGDKARAMIVADRNLDYARLRPVMRSAVNAGYTRIHLAVESTPESEGGRP